MTQAAVADSAGESDDEIDAMRPALSVGPPGSEPCIQKEMRHAVELHRPQR